MEKIPCAVQWLFPSFICSKYPWLLMNPQYIVVVMYFHCQVDFCMALAIDVATYGITPAYMQPVFSTASVLVIRLTIYNFGLSECSRVTLVN